MTTFEIPTVTTEIGSVGIFCPLDWPEPEIAYSLDRPFGAMALPLERQERRATGFSRTLQ